MREILACFVMMWAVASAADACSSVVFDYSSFSRPPEKPDLQRYLAGQEDTDYLSVGLDGITMQISPANWKEATRLAEVWEAWAESGQTDPMFQQFHGYFEPPKRVETPFGVGITGYLSVIQQKYRPKSNPTSVNTILFLFAQAESGRSMASIYLNDPTGEGSMAAVMTKLGPLMQIDPSCVSAAGAYEGKYIPAQAQYIVFPVEAFSDSD